MKAELLRRPTLETIDPDRYPYPVAEWRDAGAYTDHGGDPVMWAWEFTRRDRLFQLVADIHAARLRSWRVERLPAPQNLVDEARRLNGWQRTEEMQDMLMRETERHRRYEAGSIEHLGSVAWNELDERFAPFSGRAGWREPKPSVTDIGKLDRERTPPWPLNWPGRDIANDDRIFLRMAAYEPHHIVAPRYLDFLSEGARRVIEGHEIGSLEDYAQASAYFLRAQQRTTEVELAFDLSANIGAQMKRAERMLKGMQERAGFEDPEEALAVPRNGTRVLRFLDWQAERDAEHRGAAATFKRAVGINPSDSTAWAKLLRAVAKYTADPVALVRLR